MGSMQSICTEYVRVYTCDQAKGGPIHVNQRVQTSRSHWARAGRQGKHLHTEFNGLDVVMHGYHTNVHEYIIFEK